MKYKYSVVMGNKYFASNPSQEYTKEFLKQIREEDLVIYDGKACHAVRIIPKKVQTHCLKSLEKMIVICLVMTILLDLTCIGLMD